MSPLVRVSLCLACGLAGQGGDTQYCRIDQSAAPTDLPQIVIWDHSQISSMEKLLQDYGRLQALGIERFGTGKDASDS